MLILIIILVLVLGSVEATTGITVGVPAVELA